MGQCFFQYSSVVYYCKREHWPKHLNLSKKPLTTKGGHYAPDELIIKLKADRVESFSAGASTNGLPTTHLPSLDNLNKKFGAAEFRKIHKGTDMPGKGYLSSSSSRHRGNLNSLYKIKLKKHTDISSAIAAYKQNEHIEYAEPNYLSFSSETIPNDPSFIEQWALDNTGQTNGTLDADIDGPEAWDITTGSPDIVIAVIDTGVDWDHPDLELTFGLMPVKQQEITLTMTATAISMI